jgi:hypothetical protein
MEDNIISLNTDKLIEELKCPICLEIFEEPILEFPNQHILCEKCLLKSRLTGQVRWCLWRRGQDMPDCAGRPAFLSTQANGHPLPVAFMRGAVCTAK